SGSTEATWSAWACSRCSSSRGRARGRSGSPGARPSRPRALPPACARGSGFAYGPFARTERRSRSTRSPVWTCLRRSSTCATAGSSRWSCARCWPADRRRRTDARGGLRWGMRRPRPTACSGRGLVVGAVQADRPVAERRVDEGAVVRPLGIVVDVWSEVPAGRAHPGHGDPALLLEGRDHLHDGAQERLALAGVEGLQGVQEKVRPARDPLGLAAPPRREPQDSHPPVIGGGGPADQAALEQRSQRLADRRGADAELIDELARRARRSVAAGERDQDLGLRRGEPAGHGGAALAVLESDAELGQAGDQPGREGSARDLEVPGVHQSRPAYGALHSATCRTTDLNQAWYMRSTSSWSPPPLARKSRMVAVIG